MRIFFMMALVLTISLNILSEKQTFATTDDDAICSPVPEDESGNK